MTFKPKCHNILPMEFAVIKTGGKQYIAEEGKILTIEKITGDYKVGDKVKSGDLLADIETDKATMEFESFRMVYCYTLVFRKNKLCP